MNYTFDFTLLNNFVKNDIYHFKFDIDQIESPFLIIDDKKNNLLSSHDIRNIDENQKFVSNLSSNFTMIH